MRVEAIRPWESEPRFQLLPYFPVRLFHEPVRSQSRRGHLDRYSPTGNEPVMGVGDDATTIGNRPCSFATGKK